MSASHQTHRVAVVVFADVPGQDERDATNRLAAAVDAALGGSLPTPGRSTNATVLDVVGLATAARNGYLTVRPAARLPHE